jgi:hypothetical protein
MGRIEVLDQNEAHAAAVAQGSDQVAASLQPPGRRANPHDQRWIPGSFGRLRAT